jgi:hypothetical protein
MDNRFAFSDPTRPSGRVTGDCLPMVNRYSTRLILTSALATLLCASLMAADVKASAKVKLLSSTQDLIENTYIDRGRLQGVKVGDRYKIYQTDGSQVTTVIVTAIYDRMSAVKIVDSELLKDGMLAKQSGHQSYQPFAGLGGRHPAPSVIISTGKGKKKAAAPAANVNAPIPETPSADASVPAAPAADAGVPAPPAAPAADAGVPAPPAAPAADASVPAPPAAPAADAGVPAAPALPTDGSGPAVPPPPAP